MIVEMGPAVIRRIDDGLSPPGALVAAVLDGVDDPVVLYDERPADVADLLRAALRDIGPQGGPLTLVHPTCWPRPRVSRLLAAAPPGAEALSRAAWIRERVGEQASVIEIAELVTVSGPRHSNVFSRPDTARVLEAVAGAREVYLDDPQPCAIGEDLRKALQANDIRVHEVDLASLASAPRRAAAPRPAAYRRPAVVLSLALSAVAAVVAGALGAPHGQHPPAATAATAAEPVALVEGRVAVRIPAGWSVRRVTGGPGSARVEVRSPADPAAVLHITQSYTPDTTLEATAAVLDRAAAGLPREVFTPVRSTGLGGRAALDYTENRPGRLIHWWVILDGATRIAIGCQSATGRDASVGRACEQAVASAREVTGLRPPGTDPPPAASNR